jgi:hypothetical protein
VGHEHTPLSPFSDEKLSNFTKVPVVNGRGRARIQFFGAVLEFELRDLCLPGSRSTT